MKEKISNLFKNDNTFYIVGVIAIMLDLYKSVEYFIHGKWYQGSLVLISAICVIFLLLSYVEHDKNVMKGLMGAILVLCLSLALYSIIDYSSIVGLIINILMLICIAFISVTHFIINTSHHSSPMKVFLNQLVSFIFVALSILQTITRFIFEGTGNIMTAFVSGLAWIATIIVIVIIESKLDAFRIKREENGWQEEKK